MIARRFMLIAPLALIVTGCSNPHKEEMRNGLADIIAQLSIGISKNELTRMVGKVEAARIAAGGGYPSVNNFVSHARLVLAAWGNDFGCKMERADSYEFYDMPLCPGGREDLIKTLTMLGVSEADADGALSTRIADRDKVIGVVLSALSETAETAMGDL